MYRRTKTIFTELLEEWAKFRKEEIRLQNLKRSRVFRSADTLPLFKDARKLHKSNR